MVNGIPHDFHGPDMERVPTMADLHARGLATVVSRNAKGEPTHYRAEPEGQAIIHEAMRRNAERGRQWDRRRAGEAQ
jgi:hypothetical protein